MRALLGASCAEVSAAASGRLLHERVKDTEGSTRTDQARESMGTATARCRRKTPRDRRRHDGETPGTSWEHA